MTALPGPHFNCGLPPWAYACLGVRACNSHARRLVQAEAPPGALFKRFKAQLRTNPDLSQSDIAFFFVHWLTDLAGAEPTPLSLGPELSRGPPCAGR